MLTSISVTTTVYCLPSTDQLLCHTWARAFFFQENGCVRSRPTNTRILTLGIFPKFVHGQIIQIYMDHLSSQEGIKFGLNFFLKTFPFLAEHLLSKDMRHPTQHPLYHSTHKRGLKFVGGTSVPKC